MRDLFLAPLLIAILVQTLRTPSTGVLGWTWLTLMTPQKLIWGFLSSAPLNLVLALATLAMVVFTKDKKKLPANMVITLWGMFLVMTTITTVTALSPAHSWDMWNRVIKVMLLGLLVPVLMGTPRRIHALIWVIIISLSFFGIKGGVFTMMTGGGGHVVGPPTSMLVDNNNLALALCMTLPLMNYLRLQAETKLVRTGMLLAMIATTFGALGTYSRGGFIGLGCMAAYLWWKSSHKISLLLAVVAVVVPAYLFMPAAWFERMGTLKDASAQTTFQTRWDAWKVNFNIAMARPLTGGGFASSEDGGVYRTYSYGKSFYADENGDTGGHAAHSIYFEVLGDHGFIGFTLYFSMLAGTLLMLRRVRRAAKKIVGLSWVAELATMMQVSFLAFFVSGAALAMAYYDLVFLFIGITLTLNQIVKEYRPGAVQAQASQPAAKTSGKWRAPAPVAAV
jgi:probable O-glycosylation ligase (exosortase A-associated)